MTGGEALADEISVTTAGAVRDDAGIFGLMLGSADRRAWIMAALVTLAMPVGGCASSVADLPMVGVPADAPARPKEAAAYPAVHDIPADREQSPMDPTEQTKVAKELIAARDRQATIAGTTPPAAPPAAKVKQKPRQPLVSPSVRDKKDAIQPQVRTNSAASDPTLRLN
jgi:hypothetical protein